MVIKKKMSVFWCIVVAAGFVATWPVSGAAETVQPGRAAGEVSTDTASMAAPGDLDLTLADFIKGVREKNERIRSQELEWQTSIEAVNNAKSIFEPMLATSYQYQRNNAEYTQQEKSQNALALFGGINDKDETNNVYNAAVEGLVSTGGQLRLGYNLNNYSNNFNEDTGDEYQTFIGLSVRQPLLKDAGRKITTANIRVTEADSDITFQAWRQNMIEVVVNAAASYWDLVHAQEMTRIRQESVAIAEKIVRDNRERVKTGKMARTEVLEAEAGLLYRKSLELAATQAVRSTMNNLRNFISETGTDESREIKAIDPPRLGELSLDENAALERAFSRRPEYLSVVKKLDREDIRVQYAKNQRWPQLDLMGSYGLNGLKDTFEDSWNRTWDGDFTSWMVGLELKIPLSGGKKSRSELAAAKNRKQQALLEMKAVEVALANAVNTSIKEVNSIRAQAEQNMEVVRLNRELLDVELKKLDAGRSTSRDVLQKEEDLLKAREAEIQTLVNYQKALLTSRATEGSLLQDYNIEVMEVAN